MEIIRSCRKVLAAVVIVIVRPGQRVVIRAVQVETAHQAVDGLIDGNFEGDIHWSVYIQGVPGSGSDPGIQQIQLLLRVVVSLVFRFDDFVS